MPPVEKMSLWRLFLNNPEWAGVLVSAIFAFVTVVVIIWQVRVMKWQGHNSERNEQIQNRLLRLQHEHEWVLQKNQERGQLLKWARKLHLAACCLKQKGSSADNLHWEEVQSTVYELDARLNVLDVASFSGVYDHWFFSLEHYVDAVLKAVIEDANFHQTYELSSDFPAAKTVVALEDAAKRCDPIKIFLDIEAAIRMEFLEFKEKWDADLPG